MKKYIPIIIGAILIIGAGIYFSFSGTTEKENTKETKEKTYAIYLSNATSDEYTYTFDFNDDQFVNIEKINNLTIDMNTYIGSEVFTIDEELTELKVTLHEEGEEVTAIISTKENEYSYTFDANTFNTNFSQFTKRRGTFITLYDDYKTVKLEACVSEDKRVIQKQFTYKDDDIVLDDYKIDDIQYLDYNIDLGENDYIQTFVKDDSIYITIENGYNIDQKYGEISDNRT